MYFSLAEFSTVLYYVKYLQAEHVRYPRHQFFGPLLTAEAAMQNTYSQKPRPLLLRYTSYLRNDAVQGDRADYRDNFHRTVRPDERASACLRQRVIIEQ